MTKKIKFFVRLSPLNKRSFVLEDDKINDEKLAFFSCLNDFKIIDPRDSKALSSDSDFEEGVEYELKDDTYPDPEELSGSSTDDFEEDDMQKEDENRLSALLNKVEELESDMDKMAEDNVENELDQLLQETSSEESTSSSAEMEKVLGLVTSLANQVRTLQVEVRELKDKVEHYEGLEAKVLNMESQLSSVYKKTYTKVTCQKCGLLQQRYLEEMQDEPVVFCENEDCTEPLFLDREEKAE